MSFSSGQQPRPDPHRPALVLTAIALGHALQINNGFYTPTAIAIVGVSLALTWAALSGADALTRLLGVTGTDVIGRLSGLLLAALAMQYVFDGLNEGLLRHLL